MKALRRVAVTLATAFFLPAAAAQNPCQIEGVKACIDKDSGATMEVKVKEQNGTAVFGADVRRGGESVGTTNASGIKEVHVPAGKEGTTSTIEVFRRAQPGPGFETTPCASATVTRYCKDKDGNWKIPVTIPGIGSNASLGTSDLAHVETTVSLAGIAMTAPPPAFFALNYQVETAEDPNAVRLEITSFQANYPSLQNGWFQIGPTTTALFPGTANYLVVNPVTEAVHGYMQIHVQNNLVNFRRDLQIDGSYSNGVLDLRLAGFAPAQQVPSSRRLVVPDSQNRFNSGTTTAAWPVAGGRVQWCYDTSHFTNAGVIGPILIERLAFRAADGVKNPGGQVFGSVQVQLGEAALDYAALSTNYAANQGAMGPPSALLNLKMEEVQGTIPNGYVVLIDLVSAGAAFFYDPTLGNDLLIDLTFPVAPSPSTGLVAQATSSSIAQRGRRCAGPLAGPGSLSAFAAAVLIEFSGPGGYTDPIGSHVESTGAACGADAQSFYQAFGQEDFDLRGPGSSLMLTPDNSLAPTRYIVTAGSLAPDLSPAALGAGPPSIGDDSVVSFAPGFTLQFPGGNTGTLSACVNGYVWLGSNTTGDFSPTIAEFLNSMARLLPCWMDFHAGRNTATHPGAGMYINVDLSGGPGNTRAVITWKDVGEFAVSLAGVSVNTWQVIVHENGSIEFRYGAMNGFRRGGGITGFSRGGTPTSLAVDPGSRDLSIEVPFVTAPEGAAGSAAPRLSVNVRPTLGVPGPVVLNHTLANLSPTTTLMAFVMVAFSPVFPGTPLPLGDPGCLVNLAGPVVWSSAVLPGTTFTDLGVPLPLGLSPDGSGWMGTTVYTQGITLEFDGVNLSTLSSNTLRLTLGLL